MSSSTDKFAFGLILGLIGGAVYGLLTAPRKGSETRELIRTTVKERSEQASDEIHNRVENIRSAASEQVSHLSSAAKKQVSELKTSAEELATHYEAKGRETLSKITGRDE